MNKEEFSKKMSSLLKLIRTEYVLTQDEMAIILGISKKTLVETEKGRRLLSWTESVALASVFSSSNILQNEFGGELNDMIHALAFQDMHVQYPDTMGGKVWWRSVKETDGYVIQQNMISHHYRLLNQEKQRMYSSFAYEDIEDYLTLILNTA